MIPSLPLFREILQGIVNSKAKQGHVVAGLAEEITALPDSYDAMVAMGRRLTHLPMQADWRFIEPNSLEEIWAECPPDRPVAPIARVDVAAIAPRVECAFLSSVCGCILGKPLEINPTLDDIRTAAEKTGDWPIRDYISEGTLKAIGRKHSDWKGTIRGSITAVEPDDDINYTIIGMILLEEFGAGFTKQNVANKWLRNLPPGWCWGPERTMNINAAINTLGSKNVTEKDPFEDWVEFLNPGDEYCGALIRADAYGYACPGHPALAAELAWRDASFTHRRTGIYGTMFAAAAISAAFVTKDPLEIFRIAAKYVPRRSRFYEVVADSIAMVEKAGDWLEGYRLIHNKYKEYGHCLIYQEIGTVINTLRFAEDIGDGICKQVSQGNDTDSFGCTCGSILGAYFGPGKLDPRWLAPFNDTIHVALAAFHEQRLSAVARRMGQLPARVLGG
ncbi:MAG: hypothetical protein C0404_00970 [Verrucomicrobia bacterium]|nr:hypothetical protein [Verrucomicrobiota bacterium]